MPKTAALIGILSHSASLAEQLIKASIHCFIPFLLVLLNEHQKEQFTYDSDQLGGTRFIPVNPIPMSLDLSAARRPFKWNRFHLLRCGAAADDVRKIPKNVLMAFEVLPDWQWIVWRVIETRVILFELVAFVRTNRLTAVTWAVYWSWAIDRRTFMNSKLKSMFLNYIYTVDI